MNDTASDYSLWQSLLQNLRELFAGKEKPAQVQTTPVTESVATIPVATMNARLQESLPKRRRQLDPQQLLEAALNLNDSLRPANSSLRNMNASGSLNTLVVKLPQTDKRGEKKSAKRDSGRLSDSHSATAQAESWTQHALAYIVAQKYVKSLECTEEALRLDPQNSASWQCRGTALLALRRGPEAAQAFQRAVALDSHDPEAWFGFGRACLQLEMYQQAINSFARTLQAAPAHYEALLAQGRTQLLLQQYGAACETFESAVKLKPEEGLLWCQYGEALIGAHRREVAIECFERFTELNPTEADSWLRLANLLCQLGRPTEALVNYQTALEIAPDDPDIWFNRGLANGELGRDEDAARCFQQVLELNPHDVAARYQLALTHLQRFIEALQQGRVFNAKEHWQIAVNHGRQTVLADWYAQELYYLQTAASLGHQRLVKALITRLAGNELLAPLNCALDYLLTQDQEKVASLPAHIRRQVESMINLLHPMAFCAVK